VIASLLEQPDPDAVRLVYADRPLQRDLLDHLTAHP
jgi:hypothetical protein